MPGRAYLALVLSAAPPRRRSRAGALPWTGSAWRWKARHSPSSWRKMVVAHIPVAERTWSREALEAEDPAMSLRLHARNSRRICERVAGLLWAVESAAAADADAAALWADLQEQRRTSMRTYARALARKTELREDVRTITETMWAMIPALYLRLVRDAGWPPDRFETWLGETFIQLWLP